MQPRVYSSTPTSNSTSFTAAVTANTPPHSVSSPVKASGHIGVQSLSNKTTLTTFYMDNTDTEAKKSVQRSLNLNSTLVANSNTSNSSFCAGDSGLNTKSSATKKKRGKSLKNRNPMQNRYGFQPTAVSVVTSIAPGRSWK